jgi:hypothetical protein
VRPCLIKRKKGGRENGKEKEREGKREEEGKEGPLSYLSSIGWL